MGERRLEGAEAKVFGEALWDLLDEANLSQFDDYDTGVKVFDIVGIVLILGSWIVFKARARSSPNSRDTISEN